ncbi:MAG: DUF4266 domain-containing protein [Cytophagia bacterium]|nr:DUF4266 domain-containing protein [Cytophagia bacterium]
MKKIILVLGVLLLIVVSNSCSPVRAYQRAYLNDAEMELSARTLDYFCTNFQSYREGASGANGGKVGGGCGCN